MGAGNGFDLVLSIGHGQSANEHTWLITPATYEGLDGLVDQLAVVERHPSLTAVRLNSPNLELNAYACGKKNHANHNGTRKQHRLLHGNSQSLAVGSG